MESNNNTDLQHQENPSQEDDLNKQQTDTTKKTLAKRIQLILVLVVMMAAIGAVGWFLWLKPLQPQAAAQSPIKHHTAASTTPAHKVITPVNNSDKSTAVPEPEKNTIVSTVVTPDKEAVETQKMEGIATVPSPLAGTQVDDPISPVKNSVDESQPNTASSTQKVLTLLRGDIHDLRTITASLRKQLVRQQQQQLVHTLNELISPNITLPKSLLFWQGIALQHGISAEQRKQALLMAALAKQAIKHNKQWLTTLKNMSPQYQSTPSKNIIPDTYWWQRWLGKHLSLRRLPDEQVQSNIKLTKTVNAMIHILSHEQWLQQKSWHELLQQLRNDGLASNLPKDISHIGKDKNNMRHIAQQWKEKIQ